MNIKEQWKSTSIEESEICDFESETAWEDDGSEAVSGGGCNHKTQFSDDASSYTRRDYSIRPRGTRMDQKSRQWMVRIWKKYQEVLALHTKQEVTPKASTQVSYSNIHQRTMMEP